MANRDMRKFEERAQKLVGLAFSICEREVAGCDDSPPPRKGALCAAALMLQETLKAFVAVAKSI